MKRAHDHNLVSCEGSNAMNKMNQEIGPFLVLFRRPRKEYEKIYERKRMN